MTTTPFALQDRIGVWRRRARWPPRPGSARAPVPAFAAVIWPSSAASTRTSTSSAEELIVVDRAASRGPGDRAVLAEVAPQERDVEPVGVRATPPWTSVIATTRAPALCSRRAVASPTLPKPWTATRAPRSSKPPRRAASAIVYTTPCPVASRAADRPADGDRLAGDDARHGVAAVHRDGVHDPGHRLGVGTDIGRRDVGVGADDALELGREAAGQGLELLRAHRAADRRSRRPWRRRTGRRPGPHFQVIHMASARTSSRSVRGWNRRPPLAGPRATLCWTR